MVMVKLKLVKMKGVYSKMSYQAFGRRFLIAAHSVKIHAYPVFAMTIKRENVTRILIKGFEEEGYLPLKLCKAFMTYCFFEEKAVSEEMLLDSFEQYVDESDKLLIRKFRKGEGKSDDVDDFIDILDRYKARRIKSLEDGIMIVKLVVELAHKELLQAPKYIRDAWATVFANHPQFDSVEALTEVILRSQPSVKKVWEMLKYECNNNAERETIEYLKKFIRGLDYEKLCRFLKFATGADNICVSEITINFSPLDGFLRRPIAHICGCVIEMPCSYTSLPDFRCEWLVILQRDEWSNDISNGINHVQPLKRH